MANSDGVSILRSQIAKAVTTLIYTVPANFNLVLGSVWVSSAAGNAQITVSLLLNGDDALPHDLIGVAGSAGYGIGGTMVAVVPAGATITLTVATGPASGGFSGYLKPATY